MENKKAQGLPISTIILLVIGVVILVVLVLGFTLGWNNLKGWIAPSNNVQTIVEQCGLSCQMGQNYNFCYENKTLKAPELSGGELERTCYNFSMSLDTKKYGVQECPAITCLSEEELAKQATQ